MDRMDVFEPNWFLESIDASDTKLIYEGFSSLKNLNSLKYLDMSYSQYLDAWMMDRITGEYGEYLDISGCKNLQWNGVEAIWRLSKLKTLVMRDSDHIKDLKLICLLLLDVLPDLEIRGVDYLNVELLRGTEDEHLITDDFLLPIGNKVLDS